MVEASAVLARFRGLGRDWSPTLEVALAAPPVLYDLSTEHILHFVSDVSSQPGPLLGRFQCSGAVYELAAFDTSSHTYFVLIDKRRGIVLEEPISTIYNDPPQRTWASLFQRIATMLLGDDTLSALARSDRYLAQAALDAATLGIQTARLLGRGGYGAVFEAWSPDTGPCALKLPWLSREEASSRTEDAFSARRVGPVRVGYLTVTGPWGVWEVSPDEADALLRRTVALQQSRGVGRPLARVLRRMDLGARPAVLLERLRGESLATLDRSLAREAIPALSRALLTLHDTFGIHGDLKPSHSYLEGDEVVFIDPLGADEWIGSVGYSLALPPWGSDLAKTEVNRDKFFGNLARMQSQGSFPAWFGIGPMSQEVLEEVHRLRDLGAVAAIVAELYEGDLRWDERLLLDLVGHDRSTRVDFSAVWRAMEAGTESVPEPYRTWVLSAAESVLGVWQGRRPEPGWCRAMLTRLATL
jgi:hypothetical protein